MHATGNPLRVYSLDDLPPEVVAVTFAKTSRSPQSFDEIARELTEAASSDFHEKWVVGYGHSSVAEHAFLSIAIENISTLGAKVVEGNRLSSFTEKSTRYQVMDSANHYTPPCFDGRAAEIYADTIASLYDAYSVAYEKARAFSDHKYSGDSWRVLGVTPRSKACDAVRGLLPAAAKTNVGWTVNARSLRHAIVKMASHPLCEIRELGEELKRVGRDRVPTLLRHASAAPYLSGWEQRMRAALGSALPTGGVQEPGVRLVEYDPEGESAVLASLLFRATGRSYGEIRETLRGVSATAKRELLARAIERIGDHDAVVREFENSGYTFEIVIDFGAYRDIQRHRMSTQTQQLLGCDLGYTVPDDAREAGVADGMERALDRAAVAWRELVRIDAAHAQYAVPLAFHKRLLMRMNFREAYYFVRLRSRVQGHESYRRVARAIRREIEAVHPALGSLIPVDSVEGGETVVAAGVEEGGIS